MRYSLHCENSIDLVLFLNGLPVATVELKTDFTQGIGDAIDLGDDGAAGNPINAAGGHRTAYLWEQVWARESWLEILGRYLIAVRDKKKQIERIIFPRYHQLDVTRNLQSAMLTDGPGSKYLIQHSAGSGKANSIAWTAHFLAELHRIDHAKVCEWHHL